MLTFNEHSLKFRTNGDLCKYLRSSCGFPPSREAANINATERNTLPVLYNINSSTVTLPH